MRSMRRKRLAVSVLCALVVWVSPANAFLGVGDVVTDPGLTAETIAAKVANLGQQATMIQNQINQYSTMVTNTLSLRDTAFAPLGNMLRSLNSVYIQGQSLMYRAQNLDQQYGNMYPSYASIYSIGQGGTSMTSMYQKWSDQSNQGVRMALQAAGVQVNAMESDDAMLQRLIARSGTAEGQKGALQAGNEIAALNTQQLQRLQSLIGTQIEMQANYMALQNQRQSTDDALVERYRRVPVTKSTAKEY
jgi:P-type conjugative transfer protein TrbJ